VPGLLHHNTLKHTTRTITLKPKCKPTPKPQTQTPNPKPKRQTQTQTPQQRRFMMLLGGAFREMPPALALSLIDPRLAFSEADGAAGADAGVAVVHGDGTPFTPYDLKRLQVGGWVDRGWCCGLMGSGSDRGPVAVARGAASDSAGCRGAAAASALSWSHRFRQPPNQTLIQPTRHPPPGLLLQPGGLPFGAGPGARPSRHLPLRPPPRHPQLQPSRHSAHAGAAAARAGGGGGGAGAA